MSAPNLVGVLLALVVLLAALVWLGLRARPAPFEAYPEESRQPETIPLPNGLPAPAERYYRTAHGDRVPVVHSVVITGRGRIRPFGAWLPARYRFTHDASQGYRHYIETTWFRLPFMKVNERYVDGKSLMELPWATDEGPKLEQAANIGMWAELSTVAPSVLLTDTRVRWEPVDDETAILMVPLGEDGTDRFTVRFDPQTSRIATMEALRYRDSESPARIPWIAAAEGAKTIGAAGTQASGSAAWSDQGEPWAHFEAEVVRWSTSAST